VKKKRRGARVALSKLVHDPNLVSRDMIKQFLRYKRTDGVAGALAVIADAAFDGDRQRTVLTDRLGEIGVPIIGIWGEQNQVIPPSQAANLPVGTALHRLDDAGHLAHMEKAIEVNALLATHATESGANSPRRRRTA
jgi:pyruvate dehydrogenase E2 component (dihydrolipoamide acetyltransferase)